MLKTRKWRNLRSHRSMARNRRGREFGDLRRRFTGHGDLTLLSSSALRSHTVTLSSPKTRMSLAIANSHIYHRPNLYFLRSEVGGHTTVEIRVRFCTSEALGNLICLHSMVFLLLLLEQHSDYENHAVGTHSAIKTTGETTCSR